MYFFLWKLAEIKGLIHHIDKLLFHKHLQKPSQDSWFLVFLGTCGSIGVQTDAVV